MTTKICTKCQSKKSTTDFYTDKYKGRRAWCKECCCEANSEYRATENGRAKSGCCLGNIMRETKSKCFREAINVDDPII